MNGNERETKGLERLLTDLGITVESWTTPEPAEPWEDDESDIGDRWDGQS